MHIGNVSHHSKKGRHFSGTLKSQENAWHVGDDRELFANRQF